MKLAILVAACLIAGCGGVLAEPFTGNTVNAKYTWTIFNCELGPCQRTFHQTITILIYLDRKEQIFDYGTGRRGAIRHLGQEYGDTTWTLSNEALAMTSQRGTLKFVLMINPTANGQCSIQELASGQSNIKSETDTKFCRILPGHVER